MIFFLLIFDYLKLVENFIKNIVDVAGETRDEKMGFMVKVTKFWTKYETLIAKC